MVNTKEILGNLVKVEGVITAVLVGRDGLVIEAAGDSKTDVEAVGAMVTTAFSAYEGVGKELDIGGAMQIMAEFERSMIMAAAVGPDAVLAVVTVANANLGSIRYQVKKYGRELETST